MNFRSSIHRLLVFSLLLILAVRSSQGELWAAAWTDRAITSLPTSGTWEAGTLSQDVSVTLKGGVTLNGTIVIPAGRTLTITSDNNDVDRVIQAALKNNFTSTGFEVNSSGAIGACMFKVCSGGTLKIIGPTGTYNGHDAYIGLKGCPQTYTTEYTEINGKNYLTGLSHANEEDFVNFTGGIISTAGTVELSRTRLYDSKSNGHAAALMIAERRSNINENEINSYGPTTLEDCWINRCKSNYGAAVMIPNQEGVETTPEACMVKLKNTKIYLNLALQNSDSSPSAGVIRSYGNARAVLNIIGCDIYQNSSPNGDGGAIYWNGHGADGTELRLNTSEIRQNYAGRDAGGLAIEGGFQFLGGSSNVYDNVCDAYGGGFRIKSYNAAVESSGHITINFNGYANIHDNRAANGGGVSVQMASSSLTEGESSYTIQVYHDARIKNNYATTGNGGGIYFNSSLNKNIPVTFNIFERTDNGVRHIPQITGNHAESGKGGGIYYEITSSARKDIHSIFLNGGNISGNYAIYGAGVYSVGGDVNCSENVNGVSMTGNTASLNGGALFLEGGSLTMNSGDVSSNTATSNGGGLYIGSGGFLTMNSGTVSGNTATVDGGGVYIASEGSLTMNGSTITGNTSGGNGGGIYLDTPRSFIMNAGEVSGNSAGIDKKGGGICCVASAQESESTNSVVLNGGLIIGNEAKYGGGIYLSKRNVLCQTGSDGSTVTISNNTATAWGGGVFVDLRSRFTMHAGTLYKNSATKDQDPSNGGKGGGCYVRGGHVFLKQCTVTENEADRVGAGLYAVDENSVPAYMTVSDNCVISKNRAVMSGGGFFVARGSIVSMEKGTVSENVCNTHYGGGVCISSGTFSFTGGSILNNTGNRGGGIGIIAGTCTVSDGVISDNAASVLQGSAIEGGRGGGVFVGYDETTKNYGKLIMEGGVISNNTAEAEGGGLYAFNDRTRTSEQIAADGEQTITISGGDIIGNTSINGGGVYTKYNIFNFIDGNISSNVSEGRGGGLSALDAVVDIDGGNITLNKAINGGGVYIDTGTSMTFGNGTIIGNQALVNVTANGTNTVTFTTAKGVASGLLGVGGGVFVGNGDSAEKKTTLSFDGTGDFGLYNNVAEIAADDIYANGSYTTVTLPYVGGMDMSGYNATTSELYWVEDYMTGDTKYNEGTNIAPSGYSAMRYRDAVAAQRTVYIVPAQQGGTTYTNKFMALSLGHEIIYVTLVRSGLIKGENALYRVYRWDNNQTPGDESDDTWKVYSELMVYGPEDATTENASTKSSSRRIALFSGKWKVEEIGWAWTYQHDNVIEKEITGSSSAQEKSFVFTGNKYPSTDEKYMSPQHYAESVVTNDFSAGTSVTNKAAPASSNSF